MKLSLMTINLSLRVLMDEHFRPVAEPDMQAYEEIFRKAHELGFTAVDISGGELEAFGTETVGALLAKYDLACASVIFFENYTASDPQETARIAQEAQETGTAWIAQGTQETETARIAQRTQKIIDACEAIGCKVLMLVAAGAQPGRTREELFRGLCANLQAAVDYAGDRVKVCVEDFPSTEVPMSSSQDMRKLLDSVTGLHLVYDSANMLTENEEPIAYYEQFADRIAHIHLKDVRIAGGDFGDLMRSGQRMITTKHGTGVIPFPELGQCMRAHGYDGYMAVEFAFDPDIPEDAWQAIRDEKDWLETTLELTGQGT